MSDDVDTSETQVDHGEAASGHGRSSEATHHVSWFLKKPHGYAVLIAVCLPPLALVVVPHVEFFAIVVQTGRWQLTPADSPADSWLWTLTGVLASVAMVAGMATWMAMALVVPIAMYWRGREWVTRAWAVAMVAIGPALWIALVTLVVIDPLGVYDWFID